MRYTFHASTAVAVSRTAYDLKQILASFTEEPTRDVLELGNELIEVNTGNLQLCFIRTSTCSASGVQRCPLSVWKSIAASSVSTLFLAASPSPSLILPSIRSSQPLLWATEAIAWHISGRMGFRTPGFVLPSAERTSQRRDRDSSPEMGYLNGMIRRDQVFY